MRTQTSGRGLVWGTKTRALAAALMLTAVMAMSVLAPAPARASAFPGANGKIVFTSDRTTGTGVNNPDGDFEIFSMNPDGTALKQLTKNSVSDSNPSYSPDGKKIVFVSTRSGPGNPDVLVMNSDGTGQKNITNDPAQDETASFSPDGRKIVFVSDRKGNNDVFVMNSDGTGLTPLTTDPASDRDPTFSPTGEEIAFSSTRGGGDPEVFVMSPDGTQQTPLTANDLFGDGKPTFSPDGQKIAFMSNRSGGGDFTDFDIFVMDASGANPLNFTLSRNADADPAFSADGKRIAYVGEDDGGDQDVFVMDAANGANKTDLTLNTAIDFQLDWQPKAATFTVNTASDTGNGACDGTCTLREAIDASNAVLGQIPNTIKFNIPGSGVQTITPSSPLPPIMRPVVLDGYTQSGASPNTLAVGDNAVLRIELAGNGAGGTGLTIKGISTGSVIRGLAINRFNDGIEIQGDTVGNRIEGNFIGTSPSGTVDRGNTDDGVNLFNGPTENVIGGATPAARNVISGNTFNAIFVNGANDNSIRGNYIGTDKTGTKAIPNGDGPDGGGMAVRIINNSSGNTVGGTTAGARNLVSGNGAVAVGITGDTTSNNEVLGNHIGTTASGTDALGNGEAGVFIQGLNNTLGDGTAGGSNTIAFNADDGVQIRSGEGNKISRNSIFSNTGLGIDLVGGFEDVQGNTANDPGDIDTGANGLQNKPVISSAKTSSTKTTITGKLASSPDTTYTIEFFSNPSGNEGKKFIGQKIIITDAASGNATFAFSPAARVPVGQTVTATARPTLLEATAVGTSEFSAPRTVSSP